MVNFIRILTTITFVLMLFSCSKNQTHKQDVVREMIIIVGISPNYPEEAVINKIEGSVVLEFLVTKEGIVKDPVVVSSNPNGIFEKEAIRAILKYKFLPRSINKEMVDARATLTIDFKLDKNDI